LVWLPRWALISKRTRFSSEIVSSLLVDWERRFSRSVRVSGFWIMTVFPYNTAKTVAEIQIISDPIEFVKNVRSAILVA